MDASGGQPQRVRMEEVVSNVQDMVYDFFKSFMTDTGVDDDQADVRSGYVDQMTRIRDGLRSTIMVDWSDLDRFDSNLARVVMMEFPRFEPAFRAGFEKFMAEFMPRPDDIIDENSAGYFVAFVNVSSAFTIRQLRCGIIGYLVTLKGTVTRTSQVRPELWSGIFKCLDCGTDSEPVVQEFKYTEPHKCQNAGCTNTSNWSLLMEHGESKFVDWQKVKVQENSNEIPAGSMPRTMDLILRGDCVETVKPGDKCLFVGHLAVIPEVGKLLGTQERQEVQRQLKRSEQGTNARDDSAPAVGMNSLGTREMIYKLAFIVCAVLDSKGSVAPMVKQTITEDESEFTPAEIQQIDLMREDQPMAKLSACIAPNVFGHDGIKLGILLQLLGGVRKRTGDGITLRGDINVCVVGDPSTAKSQFLKYIGTNLPRAIYTSGKSSSASGLTATVVKDADTKEFTIEAGALMLADEGICCIDEFDKMDIQDQVAIHEAMEQQTISLAKAGLKATLNARASILAAANPIEGRYDKTKPLRANVAMTSPIMSRFDLFFIVTDDLDDEKDEKLAQRIVSLHREGDSSAATPYQFKDFLLYLRHARQMKPCLTSAAAELLVEQYRKMRQNSFINGKTSVRVTTRQLESMVRLSEAVARVFCKEQVEPKHVRHAINLMDASLSQLQIDPGRITVDDDDDDGDDGGNGGGDAPAPANATQTAEPATPAADTQDTLPADGTPLPPDTQESAANSQQAPHEQLRGAPPKRRKVKKVQLSHSVFERIKNSLLGILRTRGDKMRQSELEATALEGLGGTEFVGTSMAAGAKTIRLVLAHLLKSESRAYQIIDITDPETDDQPEDRRIKLLHFDMDSTNA